MQSLVSGMADVIFEGEDLGDMLGNLAKSFARTAFEAQAMSLLFGTGTASGFEGILSSLGFGGGSAASSPVVQKAGGGIVFGAGTSTSDSIDAKLSRGEYVVRAAGVTPETLPILEAINRGGIVPKLGFANGGAVSGVQAGAAALGGLAVNIHNYGGGEVSAEMSPDGRALEVVVHGVVNNGIASGRYHKALSATYGLRKKSKGG
mgnify:FL=1